LSETAEEIRADILAHGVSDRGVLRQHYDTDALDASTLLAPLFGFLPGSDERIKNTVNAISTELSENGFVLRYVTGETDDGLSGKEGTFLICGFWLVSALTIIAEMRRANDLMACCGSPHPSASTPKNSKSSARATSAPSRKPSPTSPSSKPPPGPSSPTDSPSGRDERDPHGGRSGRADSAWDRKAGSATR
jgi:hypothetical protein